MPGIYLIIVHLAFIYTDMSTTPGLDVIALYIAGTDTVLCSSVYQVTSKNWYAISYPSHNGFLETWELLILVHIWGAFLDFGLHCNGIRC